jgi:AraC-like DNA-binding protein
VRVNPKIYRQPSVLSLGSVTTFQSAPLAESPKARYWIDWRIEKLKDFIDNCEGKIEDLEALCEQLQLDISGRYAGMLFKRLIGVGLREYSMRQRVNIAAKRLRATPGSIKEIAADVGYQRSAELCRRFKEVFHLSPTQYRRTCRLAEQMWTTEIRERPDAGRHSTNGRMVSSVR